MATPDLGTVALFGALAFIPPLAFLFWLRGRERYHPEPSGPLLRAFLWGAIGGVLLALVIQILFLGVAFALLVVVIAPLSEELTKALGLRWVRDDHPEPEDGLIYGAAAGFGFAATENLVYQIAAYLGSDTPSLVGTALGTGALRSVTSVLVHASATALVGLALWMMRRGEAGPTAVVVAYLAAVLLHAAFNGALLVDDVLGFGVALAIALGVGWSTVKRVRRLDASGAPGRLAPAVEPPRG